VLRLGDRDERTQLLQGEGVPAHGQILARLMEPITNN
jgi:hypothetical protein